jgi:hypothetical protein
MNNQLQKTGGISAIIAAATYLFAMGLVVSLLQPVADTNLGFQEYMTFLTANKTLLFIWNFSMYIINGICQTILVWAIYERLKNSSLIMSKLASTFGLIWVAFVFLSGFILIYGTDALINLYGKNQNQAEMLKNTLDTITMAIDHSDKLLGCLWIGLISVAAIKSKVFPRIINIFGLIISIFPPIGIIIPALISISYVFGIGIIVWLLAVGIYMIKNVDIILNADNADGTDFRR